MNLLILDHNRNEGDWGARELRHALSGATVWVRRPPHEDLPDPQAASTWRQWDAVILSGSLTPALDRSRWVLRVVEWVRRACAEELPVLGVCFGHQLLARALGGDSHVAEKGPKEFGRIEVARVGESRLLHEVAPKFAAASAHQDSVIRLPEGWKRTAESKACAIQAMEHESKPFFGVQFHPERAPGVRPVFQNFLTQVYLSRR